MLGSGQHQVGGIHVKAVSIVHFLDEFLDQLVVKRQRSAATRALQVMVVRLADPLEHGIAGAQPRFGNQSYTPEVAQYPVHRRFVELRALTGERSNDLGNGHVLLHRSEYFDNGPSCRRGPEPRAS